MNTTDVKIHNMSEDDKLLYQEDMIDLDGMPTSNGWEILKGIVLAEKKSALVELVKAIKADKEEKSND